MPRGMSALQEAFVHHVLLGKTQAQAYLDAGYKEPPSRQELAVKACLLAKKPLVAAAIEEGKMVQAEEALLTRKDAVRIVAGIALRKGKDKNAKSRDVIAAVAQASKMLGYDSPSKVEVKLEGSLLHRIRSAPTK